MAFAVGLNPREIIHSPNAKIIQDGGQHGGQPRFVEYFTRILDLFYAGLP
jgi:hypothetical protein